MAADTTKQYNASVTVVIVTTIYIVYNIPSLINYIMFSIASLMGGNEYFKIYGNETLYWYAWVFTTIVTTCLNAATNPIVYFCRMEGFRRFVSSLELPKTSGSISKSARKTSAGGANSRVLASPASLIEAQRLDPENSNRTDKTSL
eukprot:sb/3473891/